MNIRSNPDSTLPAVTTGPLPSSRKIFSTPEAAPDLRVPLREIILSKNAGEPNLPVYDTSGPYTDPNVLIDVNAVASRNMKVARSSRKITAMSAPSMPPLPSRRTISRSAVSAMRRSPSSNSLAPASSPRR